MSGIAHIRHVDLKVGGHVRDAQVGQINLAAFGVCKRGEIMIFAQLNEFLMVYFANNTRKLRTPLWNCSWVGHSCALEHRLS